MLPDRPLRIIFDITHPAQVHFFKNVIRRLQGDGHAVLVTTREKDVAIPLLDALGIEHRCLSRMGRGMAGMLKELLVRHARMLRIAAGFKPDVLVARMGISIGPTGMLLRIPRIVFEDTEHARLQALLSLPFATHIVTGSGYLRDYGARQVRFRGVPHLAYTQPHVFRPDPDALRRFGVDPDRPYIVLRTVAWKAAHDAGIAALSTQRIADAVNRLSRFGRVYITSEKPLPAELEPYRNPVPVDRLLDLLACARLAIGESNTIGSEAAALGVPAIVCQPLRVGYMIALEKQWGLAANADTLEEGLAIAEQWLADPDLARRWRQKRQAMLDDCEDVTGFMHRLILDIATARATRGDWKAAGHPQVPPVSPPADSSNPEHARASSSPGTPEEGREGAL